MKKEKAHLSARIIAMLFLLGFFIIKSSEDRLRHNETLDLTGKDTFWKVSLNITWGYNTILRVTPRRDDFAIPSEIEVSIVDGQDTVYHHTLERIHDGGYLGYFQENLDLNDAISPYVKNLSIEIVYGGHKSYILLE